MKGELGTRPGRRGGEGKLIADLRRELDEAAELGGAPRPDTAVVFTLDRRNNAVTLERIDADEATEEYLSDTWGGGRYQIRMEGEGRYLGSINVRVGGAPGAGARSLATGEGAPVDPPPALDPERERLARQVEELHRKLDQLSTPRGEAAPGQLGALDMMRLASEMAQTMVKPMQTMMETLAKQKGGGGGGGQSEVSMFLKGLRAGRELADASESGGGFGPLLAKAFDRLEGLQQMGLGAAPAAPAAHPSAPPGAAAPQVTAAPTHPYLPAIAPYSEQLVELARGGSDPVLWAAVIEDRAPDLVDGLREASDASRSQLLADLVAYRPALAPYRPWLDALVAEMVSADAEEPENVREPDS